MANNEVLEGIDTIIENQASIINLVSALAKKLTGETPHLTILRKSELVETMPTTALIKWVSEA